MRRTTTYKPSIVSTVDIIKVIDPDYVQCDTCHVWLHIVKNSFRFYSSPPEMIRHAKCVTCGALFNWKKYRSELGK